MSSGKYFNYCPYSTGFLWKSCGKIPALFVDKNVGNGPSNLPSKVTTFGRFNTADDQRGKSHRKKK